MEKVLQDPSLVQYILEKLFSNASIFLQEPASTVYYHLHYRKGWRLLADCPRLLTLQLINKTFYSTMKSTQFHVKVIAMSRPMLGHDPYVPVDLSTPFKWLKDHFIPQQVYVPSIGNGFDLGTDTMACGVKENMLDAEYVNIERLEGLLGVFHHQKVMTGTKRLRIGGVGHTGMVSRLAVERMFHESQISAMYTTNDLMVNMGSVEDLIIDSPLPVRVERNHMDGRIEFYMNSCPKNENTEAKIAFRSLNIIVKRFIRDPEKGLGGVYSGVHVACGPGGGPGLLKTYKFHRDLGNIYLGNLDFSGVKRLKIRAYECLGPPVAYGSRMRSREPPQVVRGQALMHRDPGVHRCILEDLDLLMSNHVGDISLGQYYPGNPF